VPRSDQPLQGLLQHGFSQLSAIEHVGLIEDQWALIRSGAGSVEPFVDVLCAAATIPEHSVLRTVVDRFGVLDRLIKATEDRPARLKLRATLSALLKPQLAALGFTPQPGEPQNDLQRRAVLLGALGSLAHDDEVIASAAAAAETERLDPSAVDANLAGPILAVAAKYGDEARYDLWVQTFLDRKRSGRSPQEVARYLHTLSSFRLPIHTEKTLGLVERGDIPQEALSQILVQLLSVRHAQQAAWTFFRSRWDLLRSRVGDMGLAKVVESLGFLPAVHRPEICDFFSTRTPAGAERALTRALERLDQSEELRQRITPSLLARIHRLG
jgi:aminopeptidase N